MAKLIYSAIASLDLYVADEQGKWDWAFPSEEVHAFVNDLERPIGTHLFGRRMYEVLSAWETMDDPHPLMRDYAEIWRSSDKIVYSRSLDSVTTARTTLEREFDPAKVAELKATATPEPHHRRPPPGRPGNRRRARRRVPPPAQPGRRGRRQPRAPPCGSRKPELADGPA